MLEHKNIFPNLYCQCSIINSAATYLCNSFLTPQKVQVAQLQQDHPPAAARRRGGGLAGPGLHCAHARHDQVLAVEDVVPGPAHQGHDGRRGHQAVEVGQFCDTR